MTEIKKIIVKTEGNLRVGKNKDKANNYNLVPVELSNKNITNIENNKDINKKSSNNEKTLEVKEEAEIEIKKEEIEIEVKKEEEKDNLETFLQNKFKSFNHKLLTEQKEILMDVTSVLSPKLFAKNPATLKFVPIFLELFKNKQIYENVAILLGTICFQSNNFKNALFKNKIFELMDFNMKHNSFLIHNLCINNKIIFEYFRDNYYSEERDLKDERILYLFEFFN